jgi:drug/metabolite transporter (DMT)-like permease
LIYLCLRILFNTSFSQLLKWAQVRDGQMLPAALVNYLVASLLTALAWALWGNSFPQSVAVWLGILTGLCYAISLLGLETAIRISGVSIAVAVLQLSVMVPTLFSMIAFRERPGLLQALGIVLAMVALPLLSQSRTTRNGEPAPARKIASVMLSLFLITGLSGVTMKLAQTYALPGDRYAYAFLVFAVSVVVVGAAMWFRKPPWGKSALPVGSLVGIANAVQLECTLRALAALPAVIVFPVSTALTVALNTLLSVRLWGEQLDLRARWGIVMALAAAVLMNL